MRVFVSVGWPHDQRTPRPPRAAQELGGNAACVVEDFRDGELEAIVPKLIFGAFYQSGQSCISVQRLLIREARAAAPPPADARTWAPRQRTRRCAAGHCRPLAHAAALPDGRVLVRLYAAGACGYGGTCVFAGALVCWVSLLARGVGGVACLC